MLILFNLCSLYYDGEVYISKLGALWDFPAGPAATTRSSAKTRSHKPKLRVYVLQLKILHAATKTRHSQINNFFLILINIEKELPWWPSSWDPTLPTQGEWV